MIESDYFGDFGGMDFSGLSSWNPSPFMSFDYGSLSQADLAAPTSGLLSAQAPSPAYMPPPVSTPQAAASMFNIFGQQTGNPYWGDLMALENAKQVSATDRQFGIRELVKQAAQKLGYTGTIAGGSGSTDLNELASALGMTPDQLAQTQNSMSGAWVKDGDTSKRDAELVQQLRQQYADTQLMDWFTSQGYKVETVDTGREVVQQLRGPGGEIVTVDAHNYINDNNAVDRLGMAGALLVGGAAAIGGLGGAAGGAGSVGGASGSGISTLSPGMVGNASAGSLASTSLPTGMTAGMTGGTGIAGYVPTAAQAFGGAAAGGGISTLGGGTANFVPTAQALPSGAQMTAGMTGGTGITGYAPTAAEAFGSGLLGSGAGTSSGMSSADKAALLGDSGYGAGMTGAETSAFDSALKGGSVIDSLKNFGGSVVDQFTSDPNAAKNWVSLLGGIAGAAEGGKSQTMTTMQQVDPRMAQYLYGTGYGDKASLLGAAQDWWKNNQSGMNANMTQGLGMLRNLYTSPAYSQGYTQMRDVGQGLLGRPIAGNPFTQGGGLLASPNMPSPDIGVPAFNMPRSI
jgi:hypothetical protein